MEQNQSPYKQMRKMLKKADKVATGETKSFTRLCCIFSAAYRFYAFSTDHSKEEDGSVICRSGSWKKGWLDSFFLKLSFCPRNLFCLQHVYTKETEHREPIRTWFLALCGCRDPVDPVQRTAAALLRTPHPSRFAVTLFMESRGAGVRGGTKDEALKLRRQN